jgi:hypothetical protein
MGQKAHPRPGSNAITVKSTQNTKKVSMALVGIEPKTFELLARRSNQTELESRLDKKGQGESCLDSFHFPDAKSTRPGIIKPASARLAPGTTPTFQVAQRQPTATVEYSFCVLSSAG